MTNSIQDIILLSECLRENIKRSQFIIGTRIWTNKEAKNKIKPNSRLKNLELIKSR
jgi:hypothetical protein